MSEGKNDPIYNAHSYHTKVPHKAIMRYILHYTEPGDIVFDGFCGSGMTGVAAQLCGDRRAITGLGLPAVKLEVVQDAEGHVEGASGPRVAVLNDLSPAATLIAAGYNLTNSPRGFARLAEQMLKQFEAEYGWMYATVDPDTSQLCPVNFTVWSEIFTCPDCSSEIEFWRLAHDVESGAIAATTKCPNCNAEVSKRDLVRNATSFFDPALRTTRKRQVLRPVLIDYRADSQTKQKEPDEADLETLKRVDDLLAGLVYPTDLVMFSPEGQEWGDLYRGYHEGISRVHDFCLPRQLATAALLSKMSAQLPNAEAQRLWRFLLQSILVSFTKRNRFRKAGYSQVNQTLSGTLYIPSTVSEPSPRYLLGGKIRRFQRAVPRASAPVAVTTQSLSWTAMPADSVDYLFLDPPFGDNLPYAELNFLWEAWLRVFTPVYQDAVVSGKWGKGLSSYTRLMTECLREVYRILKPGRWMTVEFHNSRNSVWTAIQEAIGLAGFVIADVRVLDKGMLTKKQLNPKAVNKDLVISAYKPNGGLEQRFRLQAGTEDGAWDFVRTHLRQLPVFVEKAGRAEAIAERQSHLLFDRMVAFHVQRGVTVPLSAAEFYAGLGQRFPERGGMYFLPEQAAEYDRKRMTVKELLQLQLIVTDESSAIQWLRQQSQTKPQTFQELHPQFMREIGGWQKHETPLELSELLEQNFLRYDGTGEVPSQIHSYLSTNFRELRKLAKDDPSLQAKAKDRWYVPDPNKAGDLERLRERALLKEFEEYRTASQRKLKVFRLEAVRAGFKRAWQQRDYATIIGVAHKIPEAVLQEDPKLLMWFDQAVTRSEGA